MTRSVLTVAVAALVAGCGGERSGTESTNAETNDAAAVVISGELTYRARIALPDDSIAAVELRRTDAGDAEVVVAEQRIELAGKQVPIPFTLSAPADAFGDATRLRLQGAVFAGGQPAWASEPVDIDISSMGQINVGAIMLAPFKPLGFSSDMDCGGQRLTIGFLGDIMRLKAGTEYFDLLPVPAASGARYEAEGDPTTSVWNKGGKALISIRGESLPECEMAESPAAENEETANEAAPSAPKPYIARGNEPFWMLRIADGRVEITPNIGEPVLSAKLPEPEPSEGAAPQEATEPQAESSDTATRIYNLTIKRQPVRVRIENRPCQDTMAGQFYPDIVSVMIGESELNGCGGEPSALLVGEEWVVEDVAGRGIIDSSRGTLNFTEEGRVYGMSFCNTFNSAYELTGEGLTFGLAASTMKACAPALMDLERRFFDVLAKVTNFEIDENGALILRGGPDETILARRSRSSGGEQPLE